MRDLSVLIPFYNEAGNVLPLLEEEHAVLDGVSFEVVCVNDCSDDATDAELAQAKARWPQTVQVFTCDHCDTRFDMKVGKFLFSLV